MEGSRLTLHPTRSDRAAPADPARLHELCSAWEIGTEIGMDIGSGSSRWTDGHQVHWPLRAGGERWAGHREERDVIEASTPWTGAHRKVGVRVHPSGDPMGQESLHRSDSLADIPRGGTRNAPWR